MIRLRTIARKDLREIAAYLEQESQSLTIDHRFYSAFQKSCLPYEARPLLSAELVFSELTKPVRRFTVEGFPKYLVLYREIEGGIVVVRVVHGARNLPLQLHG